MKPHTVRLMLTVVVVPIMLAAAAIGCGGDVESGTASDSASDRKLDSITVGWVVDPSWAQVPVADALGYFKDQGLKVKVVPFPTGAQALESLTGGAIDVATAGDVPTSAAIIKNPAIRVIGDGAIWSEGRFVARRSAGINSIADLAGRKVAVPLGSSAHYFAGKFLDEAGVKANLVQTGPAEMVTAISRRDVDAVAVFQPPMARVIAELGGDAVQLQGKEKYLQHSLYLTRSDVIDAKPKELTALMKALGLADRPLANGEEKAIGALAQATTLDLALTSALIPEFSFETRLGPELSSDLRSRATWAKSIDRIPASQEVPDYSQFIVPTFVAAARP